MFTPGVSGNPSGKPRGTGKHQVAARLRTERESVNGRLAIIAKAGGLTPLQFLQSIYMDDQEEMGYRLTAATQALPYLHRRLPAELEITAHAGRALDYSQMNQLAVPDRNSMLAMLAKMGAKTTAGHVPAVEVDIEDATVVNESRPGV